MSTPTPAPKPPESNILQKAAMRAAELRKQASEFIGKPDHNPFIWIRENLVPLENKVAAGDTKAAEALLALKFDASTPNNGPREVPPKA